MVAAVAVEATAGAQDARVALVEVVRCCTQSFAEFGVEMRLLGMLASDGEDGQRAQWLRWFGLRNGDLMGHGGCWSV